MASNESTPHRDFIRQHIADDLAAGKNDGRVHTRFPPEPNGYLHIGHAKAICISFGIAEDYEQGLCNLRFDDTNPTRESTEYVEAIKDDIRWLGFDWGDRLFYASDYFEQLHAWAIELIEKGLAYVDDLSAEEIREHRGTLTAPGKNSPYRDRSVEENLDLFRRMGEGEFDEGSKVLRAKIDMASPNLNLRDPTIYRILKAEHHRTGSRWKIYPMYDFTHGQSDAIEGITHSLCSLEFENHRPLYNWFIENLSVPHAPRQIEFARLNLNYTVLSKRKLLALVNEGHVSGWDDPRMPTLRGLRRRGVPAQAIRALCDTVGIAKYNSTVDFQLLEHHIRDELNRSAPRVMAVLDPIKVVITNYPEGQSEELSAVNNPEDPEAGTRMVPFGRELWIEREDFMEEPPKKFFRLSPGREVRLRWAYFVTCNDVVKNDAGEVTEIHCTYDPATKGGDAPDGRKVKATIHWVSAAHAKPATVNLYDRLFTTETPGDATGNFIDDLNPNSLKVITNARVEPSLAEVADDWSGQFERLGYFALDAGSTPDALVFNRTVTLRDSWAKAKQKGGGQQGKKGKKGGGQQGKKGKKADDQQGKKGDG